MLGHLPGILLCLLVCSKHTCASTWRRRRRQLCSSCFAASPVMRSDPFASRGGRTCLYSYPLAGGEGRKTDYRSTPVKCQHDAARVAKRRTSDAAARARADSPPLVNQLKTSRPLEFTNRGISSRADPHSASAEDLVFTPRGALRGGADLSPTNPWKYEAAANSSGSPLLPPTLHDPGSRFVAGAAFHYGRSPLL